MKNTIYKILGLISLAAVIIGMYMIIIRPAQLNWGATEDEILQEMPGDDEVRNPTYIATRAITIDGTPEEIWPWLVQMGYGRAGYYGYDLIENIGSKRGLKSEENIVPELQNFSVGDDLPISAISMYTIHTMDTNHFLIWAAEDGGAFTWGLYPIDENQTRLVLRFRFVHSWIDWLFVDWAEHVAVKKLLQGVKGRVEGNIEPMLIQNTEIATWMIAFSELCAAIIFFLKSKIWWRGWLITLSAASVLLITLYAQPYIWFSMLLEVGIFVILRWGYRQEPIRSQKSL